MSVHVHAHQHFDGVCILLAYSGFFPGGTRGVSPRQRKFCPSPVPTAVPTFWPEPVPPRVLSPKIYKILPHFALNCDYFLAQNCFRSSILCLKHQNFCSNFSGGGIFGLSRQFFQVPLIWLCPWRESPPSDSVPEGDQKSSLKASPPHRKFCEKTLVFPHKLNLCSARACQPYLRLNHLTSCLFSKWGKVKCNIRVQPQF